MINAWRMYLKLTLLLSQTGNYIKKIVEGEQEFYPSYYHNKKGWNGRTIEQTQNFQWHFLYFIKLVYNAN
jgi:hypothetical protein